MRRKNTAPRLRVKSNYLPADRAHLIAATIRDVQARYLDRPEVAHVSFLVVHVLAEHVGDDPATAARALAAAKMVRQTYSG